MGEIIAIPLLFNVGDFGALDVMDNPNSTVIVGAQWGDEGKGKIIDALAEESDLVVRYQGGANAGHTVVAGGKKFKLHLLPSGVVRRKRSLIGAGVVVDLLALKEEIGRLKEAGIPITPALLGIDFRAPLLLPTHKLLDGAQEDSKSPASAIGTTRRGIGPAYSDLASRSALMFADIASPHWKARLEGAMKQHELLLEKVFGSDAAKTGEFAGEILRFEKAAESFRGFAADASLEVNEAVGSGKRVLFEGAQGTLLDNSFGTYPFVTSSHPIAGGVCAGVGVSPHLIGSIEGVAKAYCTRVGAGAFPTEIKGETGEVIRQKGQEYGTTTGRPRRVGWFDAVALRYADRLNGFDGLHLTKLDVLGGLEEINVCDAYEIDGKRVADYPATQDELINSKPSYFQMPGFGDFTPGEWKEIVKEGGRRGFEALPSNARKYVENLGRLVGVPIASVSVGPERESIIFAGK